jgi:hypothetical protein
MCDALGIDDRSQRRRIQCHHVLKSGYHQNYSQGGYHMIPPCNHIGDSMNDIQITEQKLVKLYNDELLAVRTEDDQVYVSINQMCDALGIAAPMQRRRIREVVCTAKCTANSR